MLASGVKSVSHHNGYPGAKAVNTYDMTDLVRKWESEEITSDQMIGQILLHVQNLTEKVKDLERQIEKGK